MARKGVGKITSKTTLRKLHRLKEMVESEARGEGWWVNPNEHPLPTLPDQSYLEGKYLSQIEASSPHLAKEVRELVIFTGKERQG